MIDKQLIKNYKNLSKYDKNHLYKYIALGFCYDYEKSINDDLASVVANTAYNCWLEDEDTQDINEYTGYLLDSVYSWGATLEQIKELDVENVVECFTNGYNAEEILKLDVSDLEYAFTDINNHKYYITDDGFYEVDEKGRKISEPHPMDNPLYDFLGLLKDGKIKDMSYSMHYNIRCEILQSVLLEDEEYKEAIEKYKKYCEEKLILSKNILKECGFKQNNDIDLFDLDKQGLDEFKLKKLYEVLKANQLNTSNKYYYVASFNNGKDYFIDEKYNDYILIDKDNSVKFFEDEKYFLFSELENKEDDFTYISNKEIERVMVDLEEDNIYSKDSNLDDESLVKFRSYVGKYATEYEPKLKSILHEKVKELIRNMNKFYEEDFRKKIKQAKQIKKMNKDKEQEL